MKGLRFQSNGIVPALAGYFGEAELAKTHSLEDVLYNLVFVHRTYCLSYPNKKERFLPLKEPARETDQQERPITRVLHPLAHRVQDPEQVLSEQTCDDSGIPVRVRPSGIWYKLGFAPTVLVTDLSRRRAHHTGVLESRSCCATRAARKRAKSAPAWCDDRVSGVAETSRNPLDLAILE